jgi:hypothetical protein
MKEQTYSLPENPAFHDEIRRLQRRDYADAEDTFNPLIQMILENILAVKILLQSHDVDGNAHADIRDLLGGGVGELKRILDAHTVNTDNPHQTDYTQTGADKAGSAAAVLEKLGTHNTDEKAHSDIRALVGGGVGDLGKSLTAHIENKNNPHGETAAQIGAVPATNGTAEYARGLATARTIRTNLSSSSSASFNGRSNISPGVTGTLPVANGGTGQSGYVFNDSSTRYRGTQLLGYTPSSVPNGCIALVYI